MVFRNALCMIEGIPDFLPFKVKIQDTILALATPAQHGTLAAGFIHVMNDDSSAETLYSKLNHQEGHIRRLASKCTNLTIDNQALEDVKNIYWRELQRLHQSIITFSHKHSVGDPSPGPSSCDRGVGPHTSCNHFNIVSGETDKEKTEGNDDILDEQLNNEFNSPLEEEEDDKEMDFQDGRN